jgi:mRNA interferase MazF
MTAGSTPSPRRGEIWFVRLHVDPPDKGLRPVLVVSSDVRNRHERADTILVVPLTTSIYRTVPTHILLPAAETGLPADSAARAEDITVVRKQNLVASRTRLRHVGNARICQIVRAVGIATACD